MPRIRHITESASQDPPRLPEGVRLHPLATHVDERGRVLEVYDPRWGVHEAPLVYAHVFTILPGRAKGWGIHRGHDDRYTLVCGSIEIALCDARPQSATSGCSAIVALSDDDRSLITIPAGVWHATRNVGLVEAIVIDQPTQPYDHAAPDKWTLPLDTEHLPVDLGPGWVGH